MLVLVPVNWRQAHLFVREHHRHFKPPIGHKFSIGVQADGKLVGVAICGRPVARLLDDGWTLEVTRCCTDGTRNACSKLYGAARRAAKALGYRRVVTYILRREQGRSLHAAGWIKTHEGKGGNYSNWDRPGRKRPNYQQPNLPQIEPKIRYEVNFK